MAFSQISSSIRTLILSGFFLLPISAVANDNEPNRIFNPPPPGKVERIAQKRTLGSGSRSNCQSLLKKGSLNLLVPEQEIVHYTTSSNPSFYLDAEVAQKGISIVFKVVNPDPLANNPLVEKTFFIEKSRYSRN